MEKKLTASLGKGQIVEFIEDDEVETGEIVWRSRVFVEYSLLFAPQRLTVLARNNALDELVATKLFYWLANNEIHVAGPAIVVRNSRLALPYLKVGLRAEQALFAVPKRP